jgi:hypothetical protein
MPSTRRQIATLKEKKVVAIPPKYDRTLFQKKGDCIEGMPIPIFQIIQDFLEEQDYRDLMNANLSTFQPIKYETVRYSLVGPETWVHFDFCADENKEATILQIINSAKDKSKQIGMSLKKIGQQLLLKNAHLFEGIGKLTVQEATIEKDFPFVVFNTIRELKLSHVGPKSNHSSFEVNFDFPNLEILELDHCSFGKIIGWNSSKTLKTVTIRACYHLSSIPPLDDISTLSITTTPSLTHFQSKGNHQNFTCTGSSLDKATMMVMNQPSFYNGLQYFKLWGTFKHKHDLSFCQNIPIVDLYDMSNTHKVDLPVLYGKDLTIQRFSLALWNGQQILANVVECVLIGCTGLIDFPEMELLQSLTVRRCDHLVGIPSLSSLKNLWMVGCPLLKKVSFSGNLAKVSVEQCKLLKDLSAFSHVQDISLYSCHRVSSILPLQHVPKVMIRDCSGIADLEGISSDQDDNFMLEKRLVTLHGVKLPNKKLQNIYHLVLQYCTIESSGNLSLIDNIHHLEISNCTSLITTEGLGAVTGSLTLRNCANLASLVGLKNIPEVSITSCGQMISDFIGLGHHKKLTVRGNVHFEKMLKEFQKGQKKHSAFFETVEHLYFHSLGHLTPECIW